MQAATPVNVETPTKSAGNTDRGLIKKLKRFDGLAMSIGNGSSNGDSADGGSQRLSQRFGTCTFVLGYFQTFHYRGVRL